MRTTQQMSITLPNDMADVVKAEERTGKFVSENGSDGLGALMAQDRAVKTGCTIKSAPPVTL